MRAEHEVIIQTDSQRRVLKQRNLNKIVSKTSVLSHASLRGRMFSTQLMNRGINFERNLFKYSTLSSTNYSFTLNFCEHFVYVSATSYQRLLYLTPYHHIST